MMWQGFWWQWVVLVIELAFTVLVCSSKSRAALSELFQWDNWRDPEWVPPTAPVGMGFGGGGSRTYHRRCLNCGYVVSGPRVTDAKTALAAHKGAKHSGAAW